MENRTQGKIHNITNTTNEQKCNQNIVDAMPALYAFALQQQVPVSDTFCWHSQHCSTGAVCLHTRIKLYGEPTYYWWLMITGEYLLLLPIFCCGLVSFSSALLICARYISAKYLNTETKIHLDEA